jgi:hypothetical protein
MTKSTAEKASETDWFGETMKLRCISKVPPRLFKFLSPRSVYFTSSLQEIFLNNRVYLSSRRDFNDPFDSSALLLPPKSTEEIVEFHKGFLKRNPSFIESEYTIPPFEDVELWFNRAKAGMNRALDSIGIYSLTDNIAHPLMWAHYADSHCGLVLMLRHATIDTFGAFPIRYQERYPTLQFERCGLDVFHVLIKGSAWSYEGEWRIAEAGQARTWRQLPPAAFAGIVFGAKASSELVEEVLDLTKIRARLGHPLVKLYRAAINQDSFGLDFLKLAAGGWQHVCQHELI